MLQRAMGALALLGGGLLVGSFLVQAAGGFSGEPAPAHPGAGDPLCPGPGSDCAAASSVPGATEPARVQPPSPQDDREARILSVLDSVNHHREGTSSVPREDGRMLRLLVEAVGAKTVVEIGTSNGYSGLWFSLALAKTRGHLTTYEIDPGRFELAKANFTRAGVDHMISQILGNAHDEVVRLRDPIDVLFIDADKTGYLDYLTKLLPLVRPGGLILSHNMQSPPPDPAFVKAITTNPELETLFVNMHDQGLGITLKKR